ncbi:hypothetical protein [Flavivirga eckloniae]|uniref:HNH endonuclease n=1 Tax=Flavivirga eckloniae TaxID=1803846 RepID=A0A2K9PSG6_9FLAO|nr:hypothetical protein [Flavivirga eckloniae]AUP79487.1 hypothetical protein C1H87_12525 [Flavivirga eckloniae]
MAASIDNSKIKKTKVQNSNSISKKSIAIPQEVQNYIHNNVNSSNYNYVRRIINKQWANHPEARKCFNEDSLKEMRKGRNPYAPINERLGRRVKMEYDHYREQQVEGTDSCDVSNLRLVSPYIHAKKIGLKFNLSSGVWKLRKK